MPLQRLNDYLVTLPGTFEVVIVDDSSDHHRTEQRALIAELSISVAVRVLDGPRAGKGAAVRLGMLHTTGDVVFTIDADLPIPLVHIAHFRERIEKGTDVVIAERPLDRHFESWQRYLLSRGLLWMQRALVFHSNEFTDTQCGFKAFRGPLAREIARTQRIDGGMYDLEYLYEARRRGAHIATVTIKPDTEVRESRINLWKCLRRDWIDVLRIRANH